MGFFRKNYHPPISVLAFFTVVCYLFTIALPAKVQSQDSSNTLQDLQNQFQGPPLKVEKSSEKAKLTVHKAQNGVVGGSPFELLLLLSIEDGWHINAHKPLQSYLIGTTFKLSGQQKFQLKQSRYPKAQMLQFGFSDDTLKVYEGKVPVFVTLQAPLNLQPGTYTLLGSLDVQACNNSICLKPSTLPVSLLVEVIGHKKKPEIINQELFEKYRF